MTKVENIRMINDLEEFKSAYLEYNKNKYVFKVINEKEVLLIRNYDNRVLHTFKSKNRIDFIVEIDKKEGIYFVINEHNKKDRDDCSNTLTFYIDEHGNSNDLKKIYSIDTEYRNIQSIRASKNAFIGGKKCSKYVCNLNVE